MRKINRATPLALAMASGLVTCALLYTFMAGQPKAEAASLKFMVVTSRAVDDSQALSQADLTTTQVASLPTGAYATIEELEGRLPLVEIPMGQPVLSSHLAASGAQPGLWHQLTPGKRAVTVGINEVVGVGGFLKPGLHVDIIGVSQESSRWESRTIAQDVPVLAIAQDDKKKEDDAKARIATSATLLVSPAQAEAISLASERGRIRLVLRAPNDHKLQAIKPPAKPKPAPAAAVYRPAPPAPREIIREVYRPAPRQPAQPPRPQAVVAPGIEVIRGKEIEVVRP